MSDILTSEFDQVEFWSRKAVKLLEEKNQLVAERNSILSILGYHTNGENPQTLPAEEVMNNLYEMMTKEQN